MHSSDRLAIPKVIASLIICRKMPRSSFEFLRRNSLIVVWSTRRPLVSHMKSIECFSSYSMLRLERIRRIMANSKILAITAG